MTKISFSKETKKNFISQIYKYKNNFFKLAIFKFCHKKYSIKNHQKNKRILILKNFVRRSFSSFSERFCSLQSPIFLSKKNLSKGLEFVWRGRESEAFCLSASVFTALASGVAYAHQMIVRLLTPGSGTASPVLFPGFGGFVSGIWRLSQHRFRRLCLIIVSNHSLLHRLSISSSEVFFPCVQVVSSSS